MSTTPAGRRGARLLLRVRHTPRRASDPFVAGTRVRRRLGPPPPKQHPRVESHNPGRAQRPPWSRAHAAEGSLGEYGTTAYGLRACAYTGALTVIRYGRYVRSGMMVQDPNKHGKKDNAARVEALFEKARASGATTAESSAPPAAAARPTAFQGRANTLAGSGSGSGSDAVSCPILPHVSRRELSVSVAMSFWHRPSNSSSCSWVIVMAFVSARSWAIASARHKRSIVGGALFLLVVSTSLSHVKETSGLWRCPHHCEAVRSNPSSLWGTTLREA